MKFIFSTTMIFLIVFTAASCNKKQEDLNSQTEFPESFYENDFAAAQQAAQDLNRKIFVDFYAVWCSICSDFKTNTLGDESVRQYIDENYVAVALDAEAEGESMYQNVGSGSYPVLAIYENDGTLVTSFNGKKSPTELIEWLESYK